MILIDSDVLIWFTRGHVGAKARLMQINPRGCQPLPIWSLLRAVVAKMNLQRVKRGLAAQQTQILPLTAAVSQRAMDLIEAHALADGLRLADALIAATGFEP